MRLAMELLALAVAGGALTMGFVAGKMRAERQCRLDRPPVTVRGISRPQVILDSHDGSVLVGLWPTGSAPIWVERCRVVVDGRADLPIARSVRMRFEEPAGPKN